MMESKRSRLDEKWKLIEEFLQEADFICVRGEYSGIPVEKLNGLQSPAQMYGIMKEGAEEYTALEFGFSVFQLDKKSDKFSHREMTLTMHFQEREKIIFEAEQLNDLVQNCFSFNRCFNKGLSRSITISTSTNNKGLKVEDQTERCSKTEFIKRLIQRICEKNIPIVGHGVLLDLCFILQFCIPHLPDSYDEFKEIAAKIFGSIFDTKHLACNIKQDYTEIVGIHSLFNMVFNPSLIEEFLLPDCKYRATEEALLIGVIFVSLLKEKSADDKITATDAMNIYTNRIYYPSFYPQETYIKLTGEDNDLRDSTYIVHCLGNQKKEDISKQISQWDCKFIHWLSENTAILLTKEIEKTVTEDYIYVRYNQYLSSKCKSSCWCGQCQTQQKGIKRKAESFYATMAKKAKKIDSERDKESIATEDEKEDAEEILVLDTNCIINNVKDLNGLLKYDYHGVKMPIVFLPYQVWLELDRIKKNKKRQKKDSTVEDTFKAVKFLDRTLELKHPRLMGQTMQEHYDMVEVIQSDDPDDRILQCALQVKEYISPNTIILSHDKVFRGKYSVSGITYTKPEDYFRDFYKRIEGKAVLRKYTFSYRAGL